MFIEGPRVAITAITRSPDEDGSVLSLLQPLDGHCNAVSGHSDSLATVPSLSCSLAPLGPCSNTISQDCQSEEQVGADILRSLEYEQPVWQQATPAQHGETDSPQPPGQLRMQLAAVRHCGVQAACADEGGSVAYNRVPNMPTMSTEPMVSGATCDRRRPMAFVPPWWERMPQAASCPASGPKGAATTCSAACMAQCFDDATGPVARSCVLRSERRRSHDLGPSLAVPSLVRQQGSSTHGSARGPIGPRAGAASSFCDAEATRPGAHFLCSGYPSSPGAAFEDNPRKHPFGVASHSHLDINSGSLPLRYCSPGSFAPRQRTGAGNRDPVECKVTSGMGAVAESSGLCEPVQQHHRVPAGSCQADAERWCSHSGSASASPPARLKAESKVHYDTALPSTQCTADGSRTSHRTSTFIASDVDLGDPAAAQASVEEVTKLRRENELLKTRLSEMEWRLRAAPLTRKPVKKQESGGNLRTHMVDSPANPKTPKKPPEQSTPARAYDGGRSPTCTLSPTARRCFSKCRHCGAFGVEFWEAPRASRNQSLRSCMEPTRRCGGRISTRALWRNASGTWVRRPSHLNHTSPCRRAAGCNSHRSRPRGNGIQ